MRAALSDGPSTKRNIRETREAIGSVQNGQGLDQSFEESNERCDSVLPVQSAKHAAQSSPYRVLQEAERLFYAPPATMGDTHAEVGSTVRLQLRDHRLRSSLQMLSP